MVLALGSPCQTASSLLPGQHQPEISHPCIHPYGQIHFFSFPFSLSLSPSRTSKGVLVLMGPSFWIPATEITSHLYTLFPTRENSLAPSALALLTCVFYIEGTPSSLHRMGQAARPKALPVCFVLTNREHTHTPHPDSLRDRVSHTNPDRFNLAFSEDTTEIPGLQMTNLALSTVGPLL